MVNQATLSGKWSEVRGKLKDKWNQLTDDDLANFNGNVDQLIGKNGQKTGESRESIEQFLGRLAEEGPELLAASREKVQEASDQIADSVRDGYEGIRTGYAEAVRVVQDCPG